MRRPAATKTGVLKAILPGIHAHDPDKAAAGCRDHRFVGRRHLEGKMFRTIRFQQQEICVFVPEGQFLFAGRFQFTAFAGGPDHGKTPLLPKFKDLDPVVGIFFGRLKDVRRRRHDNALSRCRRPLSL